AGQATQADTAPQALLADPAAQGGNPRCRHPAPPAPSSAWLNGARSRPRARTCIEDQDMAVDLHGQNSGSSPPIAGAASVQLVAVSRCVKYSLTRTAGGSNLGLTSTRR